MTTWAPDVTASNMYYMYIFQSLIPLASEGWGIYVIPSMLTDKNHIDNEAKAVLGIIMSILVQVHLSWLWLLPPFICLSLPVCVFVSHFFSLYILVEVLEVRSNWLSKHFIRFDILVKRWCLFCISTYFSHTFPRVDLRFQNCQHRMWFDYVLSSQLHVAIGFCVTEQDDNKITMTVNVHKI